MDFTYLVIVGVTTVDFNVQPDTGGGSYAPVISITGSDSGTGNFEMATSPDDNGNYACIYTPPAAGGTDVVTITAVPGTGLPALSLTLTFISQPPPVVATQLTINGMTGATLQTTPPASLPSGSGK